MIYLASTSPRRKKILKDLGIRFRVLSTRYHEKDLPGTGPAKLVRTHALGKALSAAHLIIHGKILSADTVVYFKNKIIGKPKNRREAFRILSMLQGRWHEVYTGVAIFEIKNKKIHKRRVFTEKTKVCLRPMNRAAILKYFKRVNPLDKAGAYAIQSRRFGIVVEIKGSFSNAVGLPLEKLSGFFKEGTFQNISGSSLIIYR